MTGEAADEAWAISFHYLWLESVHLTKLVALPFVLFFLMIFFLFNKFNADASFAVSLATDFLTLYTNGATSH